MLPLVLLSIGSDRVLNTFFIAGEHFFLNTTSAQYPIQNLENTFIEVVAYTNRKLPLLTMGFAAVTFIFVYVYRQRRNF